MRAIALAALLALGACSGPQPIALRDPGTKQVVTCAADPWVTWEWDQASANEACARKFERAGFVRLQ